MDPSIDVVIPLHEKEATVVAAVGSVFAQSAPATSIVVVDDGSTDAGPDLVRRQFPTVTIVGQENAGVGAARNIGVEATASEWIAFLDADDVWLPWHLATLREAVAAAPDAGMVAGGLAAARPGAPPSTLRTGRARRIDYFVDAAQDITVVHSSSVAIRRDVIHDIGGFGPMANGEDLEMWARVALRHPVAATTATTALYSVGTGVTADLGRAQLGHDLPPPPTDLAGISPSASVVVAALDSGDHLPPAGSLRRYLDSRVAWTMRTRLARGDVDGARQLGRLMSSHRRRENLAPVVQTRLPTSFVRTSRRVVRRVRPGS